MEILAKFGSAMSGFWWALDEQERRLLLLGISYLVALAVILPLQQREKKRERGELVAEIVQELRRG